MQDISIKSEMARRVLVLDGAMGVELLRFRRTGISVPDSLCLSNPAMVAGVHRRYLEVGADIIETNTFNANSVALRQYGAGTLVRDINLAGARIARKQADSFSETGQARFVAGAMGPAAPPSDFETLAGAYALQALSLLEGGVDMLFIETIFDLQGAEAAAAGAYRAFDTIGREIPLVFSMSISPVSGRIYSGQTPEDVIDALARFQPMAVGFNCCTPSAALADTVRRFAAYSPFPVVYYPNAGLPDKNGSYSLSASDFM